MEEYQVLVVGGGPAGLSAAAILSQYKIKTLLVDEGVKLGGQLIKQTHKFFGSREHWAGVRGVEIPAKIMEQIDSQFVDIWSNSTVVGIYPEDGKVYINHNQTKLKGFSFPYILIATGASENMILFEGNDLP
jgi:sarcosine oxidase subunit alpha